MTPSRVAPFAVWNWSRRSWLRAIPVFLLLSFAAYGLTYLLAMRITPMVHFNSHSATVIVVPTPVYAGQQFLPRRWQPYVTKIFEPVNRLDRSLRPRAWDFTTCIVTTDEEFRAWNLK